LSPALFPFLSPVLFPFLLVAAPRYYHIWTLPIFMADAVCGPTGRTGGHGPLGEVTGQW
jgi:hypothetical protein